MIVEESYIKWVYNYYNAAVPVLGRIDKIMNAKLLHNPLPLPSLSLNDKGEMSFKHNPMSWDPWLAGQSFPSRMPGLPLGRWRINFYCAEGIHQSPAWLPAYLIVCNPEM